MTLYIEKLVKGHFSNISFYTGIEAYYNMGFEIIEVTAFDDLDIREENIFLGSIGFVHAALKKMGRPIPGPLDYPASLEKFLGRKITESTIADISNNPDQWNVFIKPKGISKKFTGRLVTGTKDLIGCSDTEQNVAVWVSEPVAFVTEWRAFIRYKTILGVRQYKGDWRSQYDYKIIEDAVRSFTDAPAAYALDFGLTKDGRLLLVEANDGYALGSYGLFYVDYAKLIAARWAELTNQEDLCNY